MSKRVVSQGKKCQMPGKTPLSQDVQVCEKRGDQW